MSEKNLESSLKSENLKSNFFHKELATGGWQKYSLVEQMANIGSEVHRAIKRFKEKDEDRLKNAFYRALELFDLTLMDNRWQGRRKEIARSREVFCSVMLDSHLYPDLKKEFESLEKYYMWFAIKARSEKDKQNSQT